MKKGFTLIEVTIVIVIIGVLATYALPRLTAQLEVGRAAEALIYMGVLKNQALNCYSSSQTMLKCDQPVKLGVRPPDSVRHVYTYAANGPDEFRVLAVSKYKPAENCLKLSVVGSTGKIGLTGYGELPSIVSRITENRAKDAGVDCTAY